MWPTLFRIPLPEFLQNLINAIVQPGPGEEITEIPIRAFGVAVMLGFLIGLWYAMRLARSFGTDVEEDPRRVSDLAFWLLVGIIFGGRLLYVIVHPDQFAGNPGSILAFWQGGMVFYGGFFAAIGLGLWKAKKYRLNPWVTADFVLVAAMVGYGIGRWGCLAVGDDYGKITDMPWGITVPDPLPADSLFPPDKAGKVLHPTQLYLSANGFLIALVGRWLLGRRKFAGQVAWTVILLYAAGRFLIEFWRGDDFERGFYGPLSTSQWIAIFTAAFSLWMLKVFSKKAIVPPERERKEEREPLGENAPAEG